MFTIFHHWGWCLLCWSYTAFVMFKCVSSVPALWKVYIINTCWILSKIPSAFIEKIIFFFFSVLMWCISLTDLWMLKNPCITGTKSTWLRCMIFLQFCCIWFARILLRIFVSLSVSVIRLQFLFVASLSGLGIRVYDWIFVLMLGSSLNVHIHHEAFHHHWTAKVGSSFRLA